MVCLVSRSARLKGRETGKEREEEGEERERERERDEVEKEEKKRRRRSEGVIELYTGAYAHAPALATASQH